ncbi:MAG: ABC transporter permease [Halanaerobium sp.]|nr:ABC transporter permease [Halanaerobium sp.]
MSQPNINQDNIDLAKDPKKPKSEKDLSRSPWKLAWIRLKRHNLATWSGFILIILYVVVIFAGFFAPYGSNTTYREDYFHPPTKIHFFDEDGSLTWPYVYNYEMSDPLMREYTEVKDVKYPIKFFVRGVEYKFLNLFETNIHFIGVDQPGKLYLFGTDNFGRDVFSRIVFGGRVSMFIGFGAIIISTLLGMIYGGISGFYGGWVDNIMMRLAEVIMSIPRLYLLLALAAVLPVEMSSSTRFFLIVIILAFIGWAGISRVIRGMVLAIREEDFAMAAKALGASDLRVIVKHVLPNTMTYVIISATLAIPGYILMESGLSFLGLGIQEPTASWGNMLSAAQSVTKVSLYPWTLIPGFFIFIVVLCFSLLGDGVRDALDPKADV